MGGNRGSSVACEGGEFRYLSPLFVRRVACPATTMCSRVYDRLECVQTYRFEPFCAKKAFCAWLGPLVNESVAAGCQGSKHLPVVALKMPLSSFARTASRDKYPRSKRRVL